MMNNFGYNQMLGWGFGGGFMMLFFWVAVILLILWLVRAARGEDNSGHHAHQGKSSLDILKERYAKGEIDKKEFEEKKKDLND